MKRWHVQKAGTLTGNEGRGWFALSSHDYRTSTGGWFPTWREAFDFADRQARRTEATA